MYDIVIVGAGPAGLTAAIYARRADKSVLVLEKETFGGQITFSPKVENYPGFIQMSGNEFAEKLIEQALNLGAEIELEAVTEIKDNGKTKTVVTEDNEYECKAVIIAAGSKHRQLGLPNENDLIGEGISYCAVCDGAFYKDKTVAVIGGGNSALQEAVLLSETSKKVYIVQNLAFVTGEKKLEEILKGRSNVEFIFSNVVKELIGETSLEGIIIEDTESGAITNLDVDGVFVCIGQAPENEPFSNLVSLNDYGYIDSGEDCLTQTEGIFTAGDCRSKTVRQITTATGDGAVSAVAACRYIDSL